MALRVRAAGCLAGLACLLLAVCATGVAALRVDRFLTVADPPASADAIVVLAKETSRIERGVTLYAEGYAPVVVFSEVTVAEAGLACSGAALQMADAEALGLPPAAMIVAGKAESTYDEAQNARRLAEARGWKSILVVTDPLHTRRAGRAFRAVMPGVEIRVVAAPTPKYDPRRWWRSEDGVMAVFGEGVKLGYYWTRYGIAPFGRG